MLEKSYFSFLFSPAQEKAQEVRKHHWQSLLSKSTKLSRKKLRSFFCFSLFCVVHLVQSFKVPCSNNFCFCHHCLFLYQNKIPSYHMTHWGHFEDTAAQPLSPHCPGHARPSPQRKICCQSDMPMTLWRSKRVSFRFVWHHRGLKRKGRWMYALRSAVWALHWHQRRTEELSHAVSTCTTCTSFVLFLQRTFFYFHKCLIILIIQGSTKLSR